MCITKKNILLISTTLLTLHIFSLLASDTSFHWHAPNSGLTENVEFSTRNNDFVVAFMCIQLVNTMYPTWLEHTSISAPRVASWRKTQRISCDSLSCSLVPVGVFNLATCLWVKSEGAFTPDANDANKSRYSRKEFTRFIRARNSRHSRVKFTTQQTRIRVMGGLPGSSSLVAKCIPVFVKVGRCIYSSRYPNTTTITLSSIVVSDFLPPLVITSLLEQAPDWLTQREYPPKFRFFNSRDSRHSRE